MDTNNKGAIWKYLIIPKSMTWFVLPSIQQFPYGNLRINDNQILLMGKNVSIITIFHIYKVNFSTVNYDWANSITCSSDCKIFLSESILSYDNSTIYSIFPLESPAYLYFISMNATNGSIIGSRYRSSIIWSQCSNSAKSSNKLLFSAICSSINYLFIFDINSFTFIIMKGTNISIPGIAVENITKK